MAHEYTAEGEFKPLHALRPGAAPEGSNGIAVAALAGLPPAVTERARIHSDRLVRVMQERQRRRAQRMGHAPNDACDQHCEVMRVVAEVVGALKRLAPSNSRMVKAQGLASLRLAWQRLQA
ncbi:DNA mismatch repair protein MSH7 [Haematococcus lacustris]|uniref:DNA mismatch repair protein MSH7 n=1 Tax=Haematococcus lacustris TaxID=44745 RepID=A0A699Y9R7_HAELA|nr:DNA mismatch repair protein MSH7 [Haematococcus lacustris]